METQFDPLTLVLTGAYPARVRPMGPKPLWSVTDHERVLDLQLRVLNRDCTERPVLVGGFQFDRVRSEAGNGLRVVHNREWDSLGGACSAQLGVCHAPPGRVIVAHGDVLLSPVRMPPSGSWVVTTTSVDLECSEVGVTAENGEAANMDYGLTPRWSQVVVLDRHERELFQDLPLRKELLHEAVNKVIDLGGRFGLYGPSGLHVLDIDKPNDLDLARDFRRRYL